MLKIYTENTVAKYFLKGKTLFTNTVHVFLNVGWSMNSAMGPAKKNAYTETLVRKCTLRVCLGFAYFCYYSIGLTTLFDIIHEFHSTILANFYFYLQYFKKKKKNQFQQNK